MTTPHPAILQAITRGWPLIKLSPPDGNTSAPGKSPVTPRWPTAPSLTADEATQWMTVNGGNIGMVCGERAGRIIVLDYDEGEPPNMPATVRVNTGGGGIHDYYRVPEGVEPPKANRVKFPYRGVKIDARWTGGQVAYPPSVHAETGAEYEFAEGRDPDSIEIATVPDDLIPAIIAAQTAPAPSTKPRTAPATPAAESAYVSAAIARGIANILNAPEGQRNDTLNREAYSLAGLPGVNHGDLAIALTQASEQIGLPAPEARKTIAGAITSGAAAPREIPERDPGMVNDLETPASALPPDLFVVSPAPRHLADKYLDDIHPRGTLRFWRGDWYEYDGCRYIAVDETLLRSKISNVMKAWYFTDKNDNTKYVVSILRESLLRDVLGQLRQPQRTIVPDRIEAPMWLQPRDAHPAKEFVAMKNGLLHLPTRTLHPHDPAYFTTTALPFAYDPHAPEPEAWIDFLTRTWPGDEGVDCALLLAEWFGYCITRDMSHHKMLWIIGPSRGGKGMMSRILSALIGEENVCTPTLGSLGERHGGQVLIDARLAIVGDARMSKRTDQAAITERLLSLSGGDKQTFPRKYLADWTGRPAVKFLLLSNELPGLTDASGALTGRLLMLQTIESYLGREDHSIEPRILQEIPGIFNWALAGLDRLKQRGRFTVPAASAEILAGFRAISSPVSQFVADLCEIGDDYSIPRDTLYGEYVKWVESEGMPFTLSKAKFGQALRSAYPKIGDIRPRTDGGRARIYTGIHLSWTLADLPYVD